MLEKLGYPVITTTNGVHLSITRSTKMKKIIVIEYCVQCPDFVNGFCTKGEWKKLKKSEKGYVIPNDCPLESLQKA